jgi:hypothetical protein
MKASASMTGLSESEREYDRIEQDADKEGLSRFSEDRSHQMEAEKPNESHFASSFLATTRSSRPAKREVDNACVDCA